MKDDPMYGMLYRAGSLRLIAMAFREYKAAGKTTKDFAEDYGCSIEYNDTHTGITGISFQNDSCKTAFMLKYKT